MIYVRWTREQNMVLKKDRRESGWTKNERREGSESGWEKKRWDKKEKKRIFFNF